jgi:hypothetical protein
MPHDVSRASLQSILLASVLRNHAERRRRALQSEIDAVRSRMQKRRIAAMAHVVFLAAQDSSTGQPRRVVERVRGKWRNSTLSGYLRCDDITYRENFRMNRKTLDKLLGLLKSTSFAMRDEARLVRPVRSKKRRTPESVAYARAHTDPPSTRYKLAVCLYAMAQGGRFKLIGDAASMGKNTVRKWMVLFCDAILQAVRPIYMPGQAFSTAERAAVQGQFASRRGIPNVTLACDGSHIPYHPRGGKKVKMQYRNYKGWTSILAVAFVDSYYRFFDIDVGFPGRAGDNTVLGSNPLLEAIKADPDKWLGPHGVILGDCGASDSDGVFLNPYHNPSESEKCWFNFCHSSTRFFVEETFGRWKNRWRFLLDPSHVDHKLTSQMIYASAVLHNFCTVHMRAGGDLDGCMAGGAWKQFFTEAQVQLCPTCKRRGKDFCIHQQPYRNGFLQQVALRRAPSEVRDQLCQKLWDEVCDGEGAWRVCDSDDSDEAERVRNVMHARAQQDAHAYELRV